MENPCGTVSERATSNGALRIDAGTARGTVVLAPGICPEPPPPPDWPPSVGPPPEALPHPTAYARGSRRLTRDERIDQGCGRQRPVPTPDVGAPTPPASGRAAASCSTWARMRPAGSPP